MSKRKDLIRMKWREDDTIRFYRDVPDKRGVSEMVINTPPTSRLFYHFRQCSLCSPSTIKKNRLFTFSSRNALFTFLLFYLFTFKYSLVLTNIIFFTNFTPSNRGEKRKVCVNRHLALSSAITYSR